MKILIIGDFHHKNKKGLIMILEYLKYTYKFGQIQDINDCDIILMPDNSINTSKFPTKKFIFGPHFSVFPEEKDMKKISYPNAVYLQPSLWAVEYWKKYKCTNNVNFQIMPFGVDCKMYKNIRNLNDRKDVLIYFKSRRQEELAFVTNYLTLNKIDYTIFYHGIEYEETDYLK